MQDLGEIWRGEKECGNFSFNTSFFNPLVLNIYPWNGILGWDRYFPYFSNEKGLKDFPIDRFVSELGGLYMEVFD